MALLLVALCGGCAGDDSASPSADASADGGVLADGSVLADGGASGGDGGKSADSASSDASGGTEDSGGAAEDGGKNEGGSSSSPAAVNLGTAGGYVILGKTGISTVPTSAITGDLGVSPAAATYITGFSLIADATNVFATSPQVTGKVYASNYAQPTPLNLTTAIGDMQSAFTDAAGRAPDVTELGAGSIGGMTLTAGVYKWGTGLLIATDVTLEGKATDVWILQIAQNLTVSNAAKVVLTGGAVPKNVFWQVSGSAEIGTTAHFEGALLTQTSISLKTGASLSGRLLAQTAVSLDGNTVVEPAP